MIAKAFAMDAKIEIIPDIVFCCLPTLELAEQAVRYGQVTGTPVLIDIRDLWPDHYLTLVPQWARGLLKVTLFSEFRRVRALLRKATGITAISRTYLEWALRYCGRKCQVTDGVFQMGYPVLPASLKLQANARREALVYQYSFKPGDLVLTFVGTFVSSFNFLTVVEAARYFEQAGYKNVRFVFVGGGEAESHLRTQTKGLSNATFTGWFDQVSIAAILSVSTAGLVPYSEDASMSLPNKPFEYMAAGLPLLSSLHGELEVMIRDEQIGLQYEAGNAGSLIEKIRWLATHSKERQAMGRRARRLFEERFSAEVIYPRLVEHLEKVACHE
jgi:glycosyltransferase involved in cell wall biosynthesis